MEKPNRYNHKEFTKHQYFCNANGKFVYLLYGRGWSIGRFLFHKKVQQQQHEQKNKGCGHPSFMYIYLYIYIFIYIYVIHIHNANKKFLCYMRTHIFHLRFHFEIIF